MRMRTLGGTGIKVSSYCLGAMMFGQWGNPDHDDSVAIIHAALDGGINFIDTADAYSGGESEEIVGRALQGRRDDVVLATKVHFPMSADPNNRGNSRRWIVREVENSLRRLRTDYIDPSSAAAPRPAAPPPDRPAHQPLTRDRLRPAARSPHRPREDDGEGRDRHGPGRFCRERF